MAAAVKPYLRILILATLIIAGILTVQSVRSRLIYMGRSSDNKFVTTYIELSLAKELYGSNPDSLNSKYEKIYRTNNADSEWIASYIKKLSGKIDKSEQIWSRITLRLDSLQRNSASVDLPK